METAGVEPTPPRCKRGVLPPERPLDRCGRMESNHHSLRLRGYNPVSSPVLSVRLTSEAHCSNRVRAAFGGADISAVPKWGSRPDSNRHFGDHDPGCLPLHHGHHGTGDDRTRTGTHSPDKRALCSLSYAPNCAAGIRTHGSRAHEAREDGPSSTARSGRQESNLRSPVPKTGGVPRLPYSQSKNPRRDSNPQLPD